MIFTTHIVVGSAVGTFTQNPALAFLYGLISHHILDIFPHLDPGSYIKDKYWKYPKILAIIAADLLVGTLIFWWLWKTTDYSWTVFWGALGSVISDIIDNGPQREVTRKWPGLKQFHAMHHYLHCTIEPQYWYVGILTQLGFIIAGIGIIMG